MDISTITASIVAITGLLVAASALLREIRAWRKRTSKAELDDQPNG